MLLTVLSCSGIICVNKYYICQIGFYKQERIE